MKELWLTEVCSESKGTYLVSESTSTQIRVSYFKTYSPISEWRQLQLIENRYSTVLIVWRLSHKTRRPWMSSLKAQKYQCCGSAFLCFSSLSPTWSEGLILTLIARFQQQFQILCPNFQRKRRHHFFFSFCIKVG